jgi:hypothetical protein
MTIQAQHQAGLTESLKDMTAEELWNFHENAHKARPNNMGELVALGMAVKSAKRELNSRAITREWISQ